MSRPAIHRWPARYFPVLRVAGIFPMDVPACHFPYADRTLALHLHDYTGEVRIGRRRFQLQPGDLTLTPAHTTSIYRLIESGTHLCVHFQPFEKKASGPWIGLPLHLRLGPATAAARERFWRVIDHARAAGGPHGHLAGHAASAALQELLLWLALQARRGKVPRRDSQAAEALARLEHNMDLLLDRPSSLADFAHGTGLSPAYLARLFARQHGMTLQHYLRQRRMELARHLLVTSELPVSEIGRRVGLPDPQYFNKQFRRMAGVSPLAYRGKNLRAVAPVRAA